MNIISSWSEVDWQKMWILARPVTWHNSWRSRSKWFTGLLCQNVQTRLPEEHVRLSAGRRAGEQNLLVMFGFEPRSHTSKPLIHSLTFRNARSFTLPSLWQSQWRVNRSSTSDIYLKISLKIPETLITGLWWRMIMWNILHAFIWFFK